MADSKVVSLTRKPAIPDPRTADRAIQECVSAIRQRLEVLELYAQGLQTGATPFTTAAMQNINEAMSLDISALATKSNQQLQLDQLNQISDLLDAVTTNEDDPSVDGQPGIPAMAVRNDLGADLTSANGDESRIATDKTGAVLTSPSKAAIAELDRMRDVFMNVMTGSRYNSVEVHFDDTNWASYVTQTTAGGGTGGTATQSGGSLTFASGTNVNGRMRAVTLDTIIYRAMHEVYAGWTAAWPQGGLANAYQRIGWGDTAFTNGVHSTFEGVDFGLIYFNNGASVFKKQNEWNVDTCLGQVGSGYTLNGAPVPMNTANKQIFLARGGLLGSLTLEVWVWTPDQKPLKVHTFARPNESSGAIFSNFDLPMLVDVLKTGAGATSVSIKTACWAGGATTDKMRLSEAFSERTLVTPGVVTIRGKSTAGGGSYPELKLTPSGALPPVTIESETLIKKTVTASASGDTTVHTPAAGKKIRLHFFGYSGGASVTGVLVGLKLDGYNSGAVFDQQYLVAAGQPYARNIQGGKRYIEGSVDGLLTINLGAAQTVYVNYEIEEI